MNFRFLIPVVLTAAVPATVAAAAESTDRVVILHTNDTHSQIDPDDHGRGGIVRRKAAIDSVRRSTPAVLLVDAGDAVQGTLYFTRFAGRVEQLGLNKLGYDVQILGNHEFDNGLPSLAEAYALATPTIVSSNYDVSATPLRDYFHPYAVKQVGNRRIGFIGLNVNPDGLISYRNYDGVKYNDPVKAAQATVDELRANHQVDAVVAVTHIGYYGDKNTGNPVDSVIAASTTGIDVIIGGHSHTNLRPGDPRTKAVNAAGDTVLIVQNAARGVDLGEVVLNFNADGSLTTEWDKIAIDSRFDNRIDSSFVKLIEPFRAELDSVGAEPVGQLKGTFDDAAMLNFMADFVYDRGRRLMGSRGVDLSIVNKGGVRRKFFGPTLTAGQVITTFPFENRVVVLELKGSDLADVFTVMARQGGNGVSRNVKAVMSPDSDHCESVTINGVALDPARTYRVATIDYLAGGGDNMSSLRNGRIVKESADIVYNDMLAKFRRSKPSFTPDSTPRMYPAGNPGFKVANH